MPIPPADIVVTGRALPTGGEAVFAPLTIDRDRLTLSASGRIENLLADVAGFQSFRRSDSRAANPTAQGAVLRGLGGNASARVLIVRDGVPQGDPFFGSVSFNALVPGEIERARVTRGAGAGPFGLGGVAGVIEIESAGPTDIGAGSAGLTAGSRSALEGQALFAPRWSGGFATVGGRVEKGAGFWTTPAAQSTPASVRSAYDDYALSGRLVSRLGGGEVQAAARRFDDHRVLRFVGADSGNSGSDASMRWVRRGPWSIDLLGFWQKRNFSTVVVSAASFRPTLNQRATPSTGLGGRIEARGASVKGLTLRVGADLRDAWGTAYEDSLAPSGAITASRSAGGRQFDAGGYAEADVELGSVRLTGGGRIDRWRQSGAVLRNFTANGALASETRPAPTSGWIVSGRAGARVALGPALALRTAAYASARLPTLNELYRSFTVFPVTTQANPALRPERLRGVEAGIEWTLAHGLTATATLFDNRLKGAIANVTIGPNLRQRRNVDATISRGAEIDARWAFANGSVTASWTTYDARLRTGDALNGKRPAQTPGTAASVTLAMTPVSPVDLSTTVRRTGLAFEDDLNVDVLPAATTLEGVIRWRVSQRLAVDVRGENLTDARVVTRNQAGSIDLGLPRTLWLGLTLR